MSIHCVCGVARLTTRLWSRGMDDVWMFRVKHATQQLHNCVIPIFADKLMTSTIIVMNERQLADLMHEDGINIRCVR